MAALRRPSGQRLASSLAVTAVLGVAAAALLLGSDREDASGGTATDGGTATTSTARRERETPAFAGAAGLRVADPATLRGWLLLSDAACRTRALTLGPDPAPDERAVPGCLVDVTADGHFALLRDGADGDWASTGHVVDLVEGRAARTPILLSVGRTPTLRPDGSVHRCSNGYSSVLRFGKATPAAARPGCHPVEIGGRLFVMPTPESPPLRLEDAAGRTFPLDARAPPARPPYALASSPGGRFLAVASLGDDGVPAVTLYDGRSGELLDRWLVGPGLEPTNVRVSTDGGLVAVRAREDRRGAVHVWQVVRRGRATPLAAVAGERLLDVALAPGGRHLVVATERGLTAVVVDGGTLIPLGRLPVGPTRAVAWLPAAPTR